MSGRAYTRVELQRGHGTKPTQRTPGSLMEVHLVNSVNERGTRSWNILVTLRKLGCGDNLRTKNGRQNPRVVTGDHKNLDYTLEEGNDQ